MRKVFALIAGVLFIFGLTGCEEIFNSVLDDVVTTTDVTKTTINTTPVFEEYLYNNTHSNLDIHFIDAGRSGDCTLIDYGDYEILIDCGSTQGETDEVIDYMNEYITDGKIEILIITHRDGDHISGLVGPSNGGNYDQGVLRAYEFGLIIKYTHEGGEEADLLDNLNSILSSLEDDGTPICTSKQAYYEEDGFKKLYPITADLSMEIIYNPAYDTANSDPNENSVVALVTYKSNTFLLTGDLEGEGEEYLAEHSILSEVDVYKAGHHGSATSSSNDFMDMIQPETVIITCHNNATSTGQYNFPRAESLKNIKEWTDDVYTSMTNGNIVVSSNGTNYTVSCSQSVIGCDIYDSAEGSLTFFETTWYDTHRKSLVED